MKPNHYRRAAAATLFAGMAACTPLPDAQPMVEESHVSSHELRVIHANGARLQLVDWGGEGPLLLFLPGFGNSAHVLDDLAPEFTDQYHVVGLTPRGFPPSSAPDSGYTITQLANDVLAVVDSLHTQRVIVVGHSISGAVITELGVHHPGRLAAGIYLDAAFDFGPACHRTPKCGHDRTLEMRPR